MAAGRDSSPGLTVFAWMPQAGLAAPIPARLWSTLQGASWGAFQPELRSPPGSDRSAADRAAAVCFRLGSLLPSGHAGASHVTPQASGALSRLKGAAVTVPSASDPPVPRHPTLPEVVLSHDSEFWLNAPFPQRSSSSTPTKTRSCLSRHAFYFFLASIVICLFVLFFCLNFPTKMPVLFTFFYLCPDQWFLVCKHWWRNINWIFEGIKGILLFVSFTIL